MSQRFEQRLSRLVNHGQESLLRNTFVGLEKETLRVSPEGGIAHTPHPQVLGSALRNPYITTDYSEALLEFITPPLADISATMDFLGAIHRFVYNEVTDEMLWATSMPCVVEGDAGIPIARYGSSNAGMMKHIYRVGLGHRYGRMMQVIAGVHFNFSLNPDAWPLLQALEESGANPDTYRSATYFRMMRNMLRLGWMVPYLFGASPAICRSFVDGVPGKLEPFSDNTYYAPFATSLRLSDIGYTNRTERKTGLNVSYNALDEYIASLRWAIRTPCPRYEAIGVKVDGEYRQLNANILQIENEYYSTLRPKQPLVDNEKPIVALSRRGVAYVELRSLDVDPFEPTGVGEHQLRFLQALLLTCLLEDSPPVDENTHQEIDHNLRTVALGGRTPGCMLQRAGREQPLQIWAGEVLDQMEAICDILDRDMPEAPYAQALAIQREAVREPDATPSARVLETMRRNGEGFFHFARRQSLAHQEYFRRLGLNPDLTPVLLDAAERSLQGQLQMEADHSETLDEYLERYFAQDVDRRA